MTELTVRERLIKLETLINIIRKNEIPHIRDDIRQLRNWLWGLCSGVGLYILYSVVRDFIG